MYKVYYNTNIIESSIIYYSQGSSHQSTLVANNMKKPTTVGFFPHPFFYSIRLTFIFQTPTMRLVDFSWNTVLKRYANMICVVFSYVYVIPGWFQRRVLAIAIVFAIFKMLNLDHWYWKKYECHNFCKKLMVLDTGLGFLEQSLYV